GPVAAHRRTQSVVDADLELVGGVVTLADDVFAVDIESDDLEFPHAGSSQTSTPGLSRANSNPGACRNRARHAVIPGGFSMCLLEPFDDPVDAFDERADVVRFDGGEHRDPQLVASDFAVVPHTDDA